MITISELEKQEETLNSMLLNVISIENSLRGLVQTKDDLDLEIQLITIRHNLKRRIIETKIRISNLKMANPFDGKTPYILKR